MQVTRLSDYAVRCVLHLALNGGRVAGVPEIVREQDIPKPFAAKILQKLLKAGIVRSVQGARGGYALNLPPSEITLLDVYTAASGPLCLNLCADPSKGCGRSGFCPAHPVWEELTSQLRHDMGQWDFERIIRTYGGNPQKKRRDKKGRAHR